MRNKKPKYIFIGVLVFVLAFLLNPAPAQLTLENVRQKLSHLFAAEQSEYLTDAYVNDVISQDGKYKSSAAASLFDNKPVASTYDPSSRFLTSVLSADTQISTFNDQKWIEVDLSEQKLIAWENGEKKYELIISSGKPWTPTVIGEYRIWIKLRYANMKGGSKERGDYYYLPNVPYVMYFYKGYGLHGTYWHNNFGTPMSHGCVNLKIEDAEKIFEWVGPDMQGKSVIKSTPDNPGTRIVIHS
ncbi:L,D-transpeptidase [Candidatus Microgenomates bacterium]|nr:L,D-transpeptidase [Candidatus Microgenomates bacterium]